MPSLNCMLLISWSLASKLTKRLKHFDPIEHKKLDCSFLAWEMCAVVIFRLIVFQQRLSIEVKDNILEPSECSSLSGPCRCTFKFKCFMMSTICHKPHDQFPSVAPSKKIFSCKVDNFWPKRTKAPKHMPTTCLKNDTDINEEYHCNYHQSVQEIAFA